MGIIIVFAKRMKDGLNTVILANRDYHREIDNCYILIYAQV